MTKRFLRFVLVTMVIALASSRAEAQALGDSSKAIPVKGDPGISSMRVIEESLFRVLQDYAEPGATRRMHNHADTTYHVFTLLTGTLRLTVEGEAPMDVRAGQVVSLKGGAMHTFTNTGTTIATIVEVFGKAPK